MKVIVSQFIHNARNRLMGLADHLESTGQQQQSDEVLRIGSLLSSAMALLKLEDDEVPLSVMEVNLEVFFAELRAQVNSLCPEHLTTHCESDFSLCIFPIWTFDEELVRMVIIDALMNAWQYASHQVSLRCVWQDGELIFTVEDDGPGYPESILANQGLQAVAPSKGTGSGLHLARQIAGKHKTNGKTGQIHLTNLDGEQHGAQFELKLP
ncbi:MAG: hypothetical protein RIR18_466 [Pseudomonadota bacterium]